MMQVGTALEPLIAGLRGRAVTTTDWLSVIALANRTLLTPALFSALAHSGEIDRLPYDVREYLGFIHDRNWERNVRLRAQLAEAVAALNRRGIVPLLLKGAVPLFLSPAGRIPARMTSDLDLSVEAAEEVGAQECLGELAYLPLEGARGMARPQDVGSLELRRTQSSGFGPPTLVALGCLRAKIPSPQSRALHWIVHDLLKEGDYWRGRIDLRHLHDLAQMAESDDVDWTSLRAAMPDQRSRNALDAQVLALHDLFGVRIPSDHIQRPMVRFQHWRRIFTAKHPVIGAPVRLAGNLAWGAWRFSQADDLALRDTAELARRIACTLSESDHRSKNLL
jgi:putative nucleotidyltransferase-like protein